MFVFVFVFIFMSSPMSILWWINVTHQIQSLVSLIVDEDIYRSCLVPSYICFITPNQTKDKTEKGGEKRKEKAL